MILLDVQARPIIAHRGASGEFPENTLLAFEQALLQGADAVELDVRVTADGIPVVIHDGTVDRTTNGQGNVRDFSARALAGFDAGSGERIPTVEQVLESFPQVPLIIELKEAAAVHPLLEALRKHNAAQRVLIGSFLHTALTAIPREQFHRAASRIEVLVYWLASRVRAALRRRPYEGFTVPVSYRGTTVVDRMFVTAAAKRGMPVHVWTVDSPALAHRLREFGVAGIITNYPRRMQELLVHQT